MKNNKVTSTMLAEVSASKCARFRHLIKDGHGHEKSVDKLTIAQGHEVKSKAREIIMHKMQTGLPAGKWDFEVPFENDNMKVICDFAKKKERGRIDIAIIRSSSSKSYKQKKKGIINDVTAQFVILRSFGQKIDTVSLGMLNEDARGPNDPKLFKIVDVTASVHNHAHKMEKDLMALLSAQANDAPKQKMCLDCKNCKFLENCFPIYQEKHTIKDIPGLSSKNFVKLHNAGIQDVAATFKHMTKKEYPSLERGMQDIRAEVEKIINWSDKANESNLPHMYSWVHNHPFIYKKREMLEEFLKAGQDVYFLDFETVAPAVPIYENHAPYTSIPFQFSLHKAKMENSRYKIIEHNDFLHLDGDDPTKAFLDALLDALKDNICKIMVYSGYEKLILNTVTGAGRLTEYNHDVLQITNRFIDLLNIVKKHAFHPWQRGSASMKEVLPAFVDNNTLSYDDLAIQNGQEASKTWLDVRKKKISRKKAEENLKKYCKLDTEAMVLVANSMLNLADKN